MATSASTDFNLTRNQIIQEALELVGAVPEDETPTTQQVSSTARTLEAMVKAWQGKPKVFLWARDWKSKRFTAASTVIVSNFDYECIKGHTGVTADNKPVTGTEWEIYWKKGAANTGADDWDTIAYTSLSDFEVGSDVLTIDKAFRRDSTANDFPVRVVSFEDYLDAYNKSNTGTMNMVALERRRQHDSDPSRIYVYQPTNDLTDTLHYLAVTRLEDFDSASSEGDFPIEWIEALTFNLARRLVYKYPIDEILLRALRKDAREAFADAKAGDWEPDDHSFVRPAYRTTRQIIRRRTLRG